MNAKKTVKQFINPNLLPVIILLLIIGVGTFFGVVIFFCVTLPALIRAKKSIEKLEASGKLEQAAEELTSANAKRLMNGKLVLTDHYVICKGTGYIFTYDEIVWAYRHRFTQRVLLIPIKVTDSLCLATETMKPKQVVAMGKDKLDEIKTAIVEIYNHNSKCLVGYSQENAASYKQMTR
jgi:hypothetical protein